MISRSFTLVAACVVGLVIVMGATGCSSSRAQIEGGADPGHELLVEIAVRAVAPDILAQTSTSDPPHAPLRVDWSASAPAVKLYQDRDGLLRIVLNAAFWNENDRLLEATALAAQLKSRKRLRQFAITQAQQLRVERPQSPSAPPDAFWQELGLTWMAFARLRERPEFQSRVRALRRQAVAWHLARAAVRDLAATSRPAELNVETPDQDRSAAEITFELLGSPIPPLVTALLTAAAESGEEELSSSVLLCRTADWIALGVNVLRDSESFQQRLEHSERLQITVNTMLKGLYQLRQEGGCGFQL